MNKWWCVATFVVAACGSVKGDETPDAGGSGQTGAALSLAKASRWVPQGKNVSVPFTVTRTSSQGALTVHVDGLPAGVTADDVTVDAGATTGMLTFNAAANATLGSITDANVHLADGATELDTKPFTVKISGAPGTLDTTFGTSGRRIVSLPDPVLSQTTGYGQARAVLVYPDSAGANAGKIVLVGSVDTSGATSTSHRFAVARINVDGTTDTTFGGGLGYVLVNPGAANAIYVMGAAFDSQYRIVLQGSNQDTSNVCKVYMARITTAGTLDPTFTPFDSGEPQGYCGHPDDVVVLPGDKVLSFNTWNNPDQSQLPEFMVANSDGSPDNTAFAGNTFAKRLPVITAGKTTVEAGDVHLDSTGKIVMGGVQCAGGWTNTGPGYNWSNCESIVARVTPTGNWDATFGTNGYTALTFGNTTSGTTQRFTGITFDSQSNIVAVGYNENSTAATMAKFNAMGQLVMSFGTSGRLTPQLVGGATAFGFYDVVVDEDDRILVAGYANNGGALLVNARYDANGAIDTTYGTNGFSTTPTSAIIWRAALEPDGRLVIVGSYPRTGGGYEFAAWRYWP